MFERSWARIPTPYTGWTYEHFLFVIKLYCLFEKTEKRKRGRGWPNFKDAKHLSVKENLNRLIKRE